MEYIAAFDVGTTTAKGVLIGKNGSINGQKSVPLKTILDDKGYIEQDPNDWWKAIIEITHSWTEQNFELSNVKMIALSGQMQDCIPIDKNGIAVNNAILYSDGRAEAEAEYIIDQFSIERIQQITGNAFDKHMTFPKILWLKNNKPEVFAQTDCFLISSKDYIIRRLTGKNFTDPTSASTSGMMNIHKREWEINWIEDIGISKNRLPQLVQAEEIAGEVTKEASDLTGFVVGTPVLCGIGDAGATTMGAGVLKEDEIYAYIGTTGWVATSKKVLSNLDSGLFNLAHLPSDLFISIAPIMNSGNTFEWITSIIVPESIETKNEAYLYIEQLVSQTECCTNKVIFLPYLNGERCPVQDTRASGCFIGLRQNTTKGDMCRAVLEGVSMAIRQVMNLISDEKVSKVTLIGGGSKSNTWCQIISDVCGVEVFVPEETEYLPALGASSAAFINLDWEENYNSYIEKYVLDKKGKYYKPNHQNYELYTERYEKYIQLYPALKHIF